MCSLDLHINSIHTHTHKHIHTYVYMYLQFDQTTPPNSIAFVVNCFCCVSTCYCQFPQQKKSRSEHPVLPPPHLLQSSDSAAFYGYVLSREVGVLPSRGTLYPALYFSRSVKDVRKFFLGSALQLERNAAKSWEHNERTTSLVTCVAIVLA